MNIVLPAGLTCCEGVGLQVAKGPSIDQLQVTSDHQLCFLLEADLPAGTNRLYELIPTTLTSGKGATIVPTQDGLDISIAGHTLFSYNTATLMPPAGEPDYYKRSGFIHPFYSPSGKVLTDGFPVGHTHQHGIFFAWVNTTYRGDFTDFWNQQQKTGTVAFTSLQDTVSGPVFAGIESEHELQSLKHGPVVAERWTIRAYRLPGYNILDLTSRQKVIGTDTLFINKYHYGGMAARLSAEWNRTDSLHYTNPMQLLTSEGITDREAANHTRPHWTAAYGQVEAQTAGLVLFDHPANFRFPQPVRVHPEMPYFVETPSVEAAFTLVPGEEYHSTYRMISFDGAPDAGKIEAMWRAYTTPLTVEWIKSRK